MSFVLPSLGITSVDVVLPAGDKASVDAQIASGYHLNFVVLPNNDIYYTSNEPTLSCLSRILEVEMHCSPD